MRGRGVEVCLHTFLLYKKVLDFLIKGLMNVLNLTVTLGHDKKTIVDLKDLKDIKTFSAKIVI